MARSSSDDAQSPSDEQGADSGGLEVQPHPPGLTYTPAREGKSLEVLQALLRNSPIAIVLHTLEPDGRLVLSHANPAAEQLLGVSLVSSVGRTIEEVFPSLRQLGVPAIYRQLAAEGGSWRAERLHYQDNRISGTFEVAAFQVAPSQVAVLFWSVTSQMGAGSEARRSDERLLSTASLPLDMVFTTDAAGIVTYVTSASTELFGRNPDEMIGHYFTEFLASSSIEYAVESFREAIAGRHRSAALVLRMLRGDGGEFTGELRSSVSLRDGRPTGTLGVIRDVDDRVRADTERRWISDTPRQSRRVDDLGLLVGSIALELNDLLTALLGHTGLALRDVQSSPSLAHASLREIDRAARRASELCQQLLTYSNRDRS
jgi:PAS domain S-box-containing protein